MALNSSNTSPAKTAEAQMETPSTMTPTPTAFHVNTMDTETRRDITMKLTLASLSAQQGRLEDARYWMGRAAKSLAEFKQSQTVD
jgi:hypothetical protein